MRTLLPKLSGPIPVTPTMFATDGLDHDAQTRLIRRLIQAGLPTIVTGGLEGEGPTTTLAEQLGHVVFEEARQLRWQRRGTRRSALRAVLHRSHRRVWEPATMMHESFGRTTDGDAVTRFTLARGPLRLQVIDYGAVITRLDVPDRTGRPANVVLGLDTLAPYETLSPHFGAVAGRFANRIAGGRFELDGTVYHLPVNDPPNTLHGGPRGFARRMWRAETIEAHRLVLRRRSSDGEMGFPGNLDVDVTYTLPEDGVVRIDYAARTDRPTVLNLTNHSYFNLRGEGSGDVFGHEVMIEADSYLPIDPTGIPTGAIDPVLGTPFDFRTATLLAAGGRTGDPQIVRAKGYDHCFVLRGDAGSLRPAATCFDPESGRRLEIATTQPGLQLYTGNMLDGTLVGPGGRTYRSGDGVCFETQGFPDAPNHPAFPSTVLRPGEGFVSATTWRFSAI